MDRVPTANQIPQTRALDPGDPTGIPWDVSGRLWAHRNGELIAGRYQVTGRIGQGGFGSVYEVLDTELDLKLACKEMDLLLAPTGMSGDRAQLVVSFRQEAQALSRLFHQNIPPAHYLTDPYRQWVCGACGTTLAQTQACPKCGGQSIFVEHRHYLMMRYVAGKSLASAAVDQGRPQPWPAVRAWFVQVAAAVGELHRQNMVHGDIKPENVLIEAPSGRAFLIDLGLVRAVRPAGSGKATQVLSTSTKAIGTPGYAAPEVFRNQLRPASDIYALGMLLYWALSDKDPAEDTVEMARTTPSALNPAIPPLVSRAIERATRVQPGERFGSVDEFVSSLEDPNTASAAIPVTQVLSPAPATAHPDLPGGTPPPSGTARRGIPRAAHLLWVAPVLLTAGYTILNWADSQATDPRPPSGTSGPSAGTPRPPTRAGIRSSDLPPPGEPREDDVQLAALRSAWGKVAVGPTKFAMGGSWPAERPIHGVGLHKFLIDKYLVTNARYAKFLAATSHRKPFYWNYPRFNQPYQPVVGVSWEDAQAYCRWSGGRLPTEAEYEFAARGSVGGNGYPWGDAAPENRACFGLNLDAGSPDPVGCYAPNELKLYDIVGCVAVWCSDWYGPYPESTETDPQGPRTGTQRVVRGASWADAPGALRCAYRRGEPPGYQSMYIGIRAAMDPM